MSKPKAFVSKTKIKELKTLKKLIKEYPVVGVIDITSLPSSQFQAMKHKLRERLMIRVSKKRVLRILFQDTAKDKAGIDKLVEALDKGIPAVMFSKDDSFKVFNNFKKGKSDAPAKAGQIAPEDIYAKAGPTPFTPGPIIGELGTLGIKTKVEDGKIAITEDHLLVKEGEEIDAQKADFMAKLGIRPMKIGLNLVACYEDGTVFDKNDLDIDTEEYFNKFKQAYSEAFNLAANSGYATKDNIIMMLAKNYREAIGLAKEAGVSTSETVGEQIKDAERQAQALKSKVPDVAESETKEEAPKEEPKAEEVKEEPKVEETPKEEPAKEEPAEEVKEETPTEEVKEETPTEEVKEETPAEEVKEETPAEEVKEEPKVEESAKEEKAEETPAPQEETTDDKEKELEEIDQKIEQEKEQKQQQNKHDEESKQAKEILEKATEKIIDDKKKEKQGLGKVPSAHDLLDKKEGDESK
jgi:large subunit ribosomal protein L10